MDCWQRQSPSSDADNLSNALQVAIQEALKGSKTPQQALDEVAAKVPDMKK